MRKLWIPPGWRKIRFVGGPFDGEYGRTNSKDVFVAIGNIPHLKHKYLTEFTGKMGRYRRTPNAFYIVGRHRYEIWLFQD